MYEEARDSIRRFILFTLPLISLVLIWQAVCSLDLIKMLPSPLEVAKTLLRLSFQTQGGWPVLALHLSRSLLRVGAGFALAMVTAIKPPLIIFGAGPILQWMPGDRVVRVCCEGSGHHYRDPRGDAYAQDTSVMLCKTAKGSLIKIRVDMISDRPHAMTNYQLQGTDGCYESSRGGPVDRGKIWFRKLSSEIKWHDLNSLMEIDSLAEEYMPEMWRKPPAQALKAGHGGGDYFEILDFVNAIRGISPTPIGLHEAMDMTLPGLISQQSILDGGRWIDVPDSREW